MNMFPLAMQFDTLVKSHYVYIALYTIGCFKADSFAVLNMKNSVIKWTVHILLYYRLQSIY